MKATIVDLRYRMNDVLKALARNEDVSILYHGKLKGVIRARSECKKTKITDHPFFNMRGSAEPVEQRMSRLRGGRYRDL
ncbi:MAG: type II toxin-antitoxin system Phd/YefM family antitoxin [Kiritimatiellae bacterium]|nr:type II toxin-antitoxin system Phd/YefM family antitoxin [Kiritimatiellia bacterium]